MNTESSVIESEPLQKTAARTAPSRHGTDGTLSVFRVKDHLGHHWRDERVGFRLEREADPGSGPVRVRDDGGRLHAAQIVRRAGGDRVVFVVDELKPHATRSFTLERGEAAGGAFVKVTEEGNSWLVENGVTAVRMPCRSWKSAGATLELDAVEAPLSGLRLRSGAWTARGSVRGALHVREIRRELVDRGPVMVVVRHRYEFEEGYWEIEQTLTAGHPVLEVSEELNTGPTMLKPPVFEMNFTEGFAPTRAVAWLPWFNPPLRPEIRRGYLGDHYKIPYRDAVEMSVIGFLPWWEETCRAYLMRQDDPKGDALAFFPIRIGDWRSPMGCYFHTRSEPRTMLLSLDLNLRLGRVGDGGDRKKLQAAEYARQFGFESDWPVNASRRRWALASLVAGEAANDDTVEYDGAHPKEDRPVVNPAMMNSTFASSIAKHSCVPLDKIKDWVLEWEDPSPVEHPRLYISRDAVKRWRERVRTEPYWKEMLASPACNNAILRCFADGSSEVEERLLHEPASRRARSEAFSNNSCRDQTYEFSRPATVVDGGLVGRLQANVELHLTVGFMGPGSYVNPWTASPNSSRPSDMLMMADAALGMESVSPELKRRLRAMAAFFACMLWDQDWNPTVQGFHRGTINMPPRQEFALCLASAALPGHPDSRKWLERGVKEIERLVGSYIRPSGVSLENPHYNHESVFATAFTSAIPLQRAGTCAMLSDPRIKKNYRFLMNLLTPVDPRFDAMMLPPWGNGGHEMVYTFGWLAFFNRDSDPEFSREMQWAWKAQGFPQSHHSHGKQWFGALVSDPELPATRPGLKSGAYEGFGAIMRSGFPDPRHTWLTFFMGREAAHYNMGEQGAFMLHAKGSPLVMQQSGLYERSPSGAWWHSRIAVDHKTEFYDHEGDMERYAFFEEADFAQGMLAINDYTPIPEDPSALGKPNQELPRLAMPRHEWRRRVTLVKDPDPMGVNYVVLRDDFHSPKPLPTEWNLWTMMREVAFDGNTARMKGQFGVDMDVILLSPSENPQWSSRRDRTTFSDVVSRARFLEKNPGATWEENRIGIRAQQKPGAPFLAVIFPRLPGEAACRASSAAGGRVAVVEHAAGRDHLMLSAEAFGWSGDGIAFSGNDGMVRRMKNGSMALLLFQRGSLSVGEMELVSTMPVRLRVGADGLVSGVARGEGGRSSRVRVNGRDIPTDGEGRFAFAASGKTLVVVCGEAR